MIVATYFTRIFTCFYHHFLSQPFFDFILLKYLVRLSLFIFYTPSSLHGARFPNFHQIEFSFHGFPSLIPLELLFSCNLSYVDFSFRKCSRIPKKVHSAAFNLDKSKCPSVTANLNYFLRLLLLCSGRGISLA